MNKRQIAVASIPILSLLIVTMIAFHQLPTEQNPPRKTYALRVWGVAESGTWERFYLKYPTPSTRGSYSSRISTTVSFHIENVGDQDLYNIHLDHDVFIGDVPIGVTKTVVFADYSLKAKYREPSESRGCEYHLHTQLNFQCNELPKNRTYNAAALGVIFFELYWQPGETTSQKYAFSF